MAACRDCAIWVWGLLGVLAFVVACIVGTVLFDANRKPYMRYYVSIDSASGLDLPPSKDLVLDPHFNLTVRLASSRPGRRPVCMEAGTYLQLSYRCVPLATSATVPHQLCVGGAENNSSVSMPLVAKGTGVRLPGYIMDSLAADQRSGVEAFEVRLKMSGNNFQDVMPCGFRRVEHVDAECEPGLICQDKMTMSPPPINYPY